jgi:hypothetical protein
MKPYGFRQLKHNYKDDHPKNGFINWWEDILNINKTSERMKNKRSLKDYIKEGGK